MKTVNKIMIVMPDFGLGGTQRVVSILLAEWVKQYQLCLVTLADRDMDFYPLPSQVERIGLNLINESNSMVQAIKANYQRVTQLRQVIKQQQPDVIISFLESTNVLSVLAKLGLGPRLILCVRADPSKRPLKAAWHLLQKTLYRFADHVTANNKAVISWLTRYVGQDKLSFIPNPIILKKLDSTKKQKNILAVGRLHYEKGSDLLVEAFYHSKLYTKGWVLTLVGDGPLYIKLKELISQLGMTNSIKLVGRQAEVEGYYQTAAIYVLPSRHEGMPNAMLEALCYGLPVIVSDGLPGPLAYVNSGNCGITFQAENVKSLSQVMLSLAEDSVLRDKLTANRELTLKENEINSVVDRWQSVIEGELSGA